jgi:hypothetical protein
MMIVAVAGGAVPVAATACGSLRLALRRFRAGKSRPRHDFAITM